MGLFGKYKGQVITGIVSALVGAAVGTSITQSFSVYNLTRSFKFQQNREILTSTRLGIGFLKQVESELDDNVALMLAHDYGVKFEFGDPFDPSAAVKTILSSDSQSQTNASDAKATGAFVE